MPKKRRLTSLDRDTSREALNRLWPQHFPWKYVRQWRGELVFRAVNGTHLAFVDARGGLTVEEV